MRHTIDREKKKKKKKTEPVKATEDISKPKGQPNNKRTKEKDQPSKNRKK